MTENKATGAATPRPWAVHTRANCSVYLTSHKHRWIADLNGVHYSQPDIDAEANAALIVRAVNSHDALVEACEAAIGILKPDPDTECWCPGLLTRIRAALALAKGEK